MSEGSKKVRIKTGRSMNLILWFTFSVFALVIVFIYAFVQNLLVHRQVREQEVNLITEAGEEMARAISESDDSSTLSRQLYGIANRYGVRLYVLYESGESVYPEYTEERSYSLIAGRLTRALSNRSSAIIEEDSEFVYGSSVTIEGRSCFLYVSVPLDNAMQSVGNFRWISVITGLMAVVFAFLASSFVAMLITKPVTEVTECAKELARGNYDFDFKHDYFCGEITELSSALDCARTEISKADKMQKELIANVSHDFKTPLTMIKGYASMIREISGDDKEKRDAHAQIIIDESDRLAALVGDLLDLSKLRAGITDAAPETFDLSELACRVAGRFDYLTETGGFSIETEIQGSLYSTANRERIEQVFYNLIGNAINYTGEDKRVRVKLYRKESAIRFEVIDTGKGIPPDEVDSIWDRYYRTGKTHKRAVNGTGLGLSIVKSILLAQGCPFGVISEVGKGSCFWVEFPIPQADAEEANKKKER